MKYLLPISLTFYVGIYSNQIRRDSLEGYVVGGIDVPILMYPHIAQIFYKKQVCGGSIISHRVILTAAHCLFTRQEVPIVAKDVIVYLGSDEIRKGAKYKGCEVLAHEQYDGRKEETFYFYDIGLILLRKSVKFGLTVKKVRIAESNDFRNVEYRFTIAGFGAVSNLFKGSPSKKLKATRMYYVNTKTCNESQSFRGVMSVPDHMFCLIGHGWTSDCFGDSGSGVIWRGTLVGIVSTGRDDYCGSDMLPSMYTDLVYFRDWVTTKITELESIPTDKCERSAEN